MNSGISSPVTVHLDTELAMSQVGDSEALQGMLVMLEESLAHDIPRIAEHLAVGDVESANHLLHPLKGFLPIFCRAPLCDQVAAVELLSKDQSAETVTPAYAQLRPELELLLSEVVFHLRGAAPV